MRNRIKHKITTGGLSAAEKLPAEELGIHCGNGTDRASAELDTIASIEFLGIGCPNENTLCRGSGGKGRGVGFYIGY